MQSLWTSSAWRVQSIHLVNEMPKNYRFGFLDWFQGLDLKFNLTSNSLNSDVELLLRPNPMELERVEKIESEDGLDFLAREFEDSSVRFPGNVRQSTGEILEDFATISKTTFDGWREREPAFSPPSQVAEEKKPFGRKAVIPIRSSKMGVRIDPSTMVVSLIRPSTPASRSDLRARDRIMQINGLPARNLETLVEAIENAARSNGLIQLTVARAGRSISIQINLDTPQDVDL